MNRWRRKLRTGAAVLLALAAVLGIQPALVTVAESQTTTPTAPRVLFIRGALDTVAADGIDNNQLADIADLATKPKGKGYGMWVQLLLAQGFEVSQLDEGGNREEALPVNLTKANLAQYKVVVFGSNNSSYSADDVKALTDYVAAGGSALFNADRNWGPVSGRASSSDDLFLKQWGITEQQDNALVENHTSADYTVPNHPILKGVSSFGSFGVSACSVGAAPAGAGLATPPTILVPFTTTVQNNDREDADGTQRPPNPATDGALVVAQPGQGRVACFFDRDPFFNEAINAPDQSHATLGANLINWLAGKT